MWSGGIVLSDWWCCQMARCDLEVLVCVLCVVLAHCTYHCLSEHHVTYKYRWLSSAPERDMRHIQHSQRDLYPGSIPGRGTLVCPCARQIIPYCITLPSRKWVPSINKAVLRTCALYAANCSGISHGGLK